MVKIYFGSIFNPFPSVDVHRAIFNLDVSCVLPSKLSGLHMRCKQYSLGASRIAKDKAERFCLPDIVTFNHSFCHHYQVLDM